MPELTLLFDVIVIVLLATTIFFAWRLNRHLGMFRSNRAEMERLIRELSGQITRAQEGISVLDDLSATRGDELRRMISKAQSLCDELSLMTDSGNSLAERLEKLAVKNREIADQIGQNTLNNIYPGQKTPERAPEKARYEETLARADRQRIVPSLEPSFAIRDPDYEDDSEEGEDMDDMDPFLSKAERDLASALKNRGQNKK